MKLKFSKSVRRIGGKSLPLLVGLLLAPGLVRGTDSIFYCTSNIDNSNLPQVDATNFYNSGTWDIFIQPLPYRTANTQNYTNEGTMTGSVGWEFDFGPLPTGGRGMSASFFNDNPGTITANDAYIVNPVNNLYFSQVSYLLISATNIVNKGTLIAGNGGEMVLTGSNVNLSRSTLEIGSISSSSQCSVNDYTLTNFTADTAIYDEYWATNILTMDSSKLWTGTNVSSPTFLVDAYPNCILTSNILAPLGPDPITFVPTLADSITIAGPIGTNGLPAQIFSQAVFVATSTNDPNITATNHFVATGSLSNLFQTSIVKLTSKLGGTLYLVDTFASSTNSEFLKNATVTPGFNPQNTCTGPTYRPANYILERGECQSGFTNGAPGNPPSQTFFYGQASNKFVQGEYAAYSAYVDNLVQNPSGGAVSNLSGQIVIDATNLDITRTVIDSQGGGIVIQANNFIGSTGAVVSCQNLSFNLGSAVGNLNVTNLAANSSVPGLHGNLYAWSALWTNGMNVVTGSGTNAITNTIELDFYVLLVDARNLSSIVPVTVQDLILQSTCTNMVVSDSMNVVNTLFFGGQSLTLQGSLNLSGNLQGWNSSIAPSLLYFTNNGTLNIPHDANFGGDTPTSYAAFINNGFIIVGGGETINSVYYREAGTEIAANTFSVTASTGLVENASIISGKYINFAGGTLQLENTALSAGSSLNFSVTNSLTDNGVGSFLTCTNGFNLFLSPQSGNLLGSTITDVAPKNYLIGHAWAGGDSGPTASGLSSNVAIGTLKLVAQNPSQLPTFHFYGTTGSNAMYVNTLDLSQLTTIAANLASMIQIDPGMKIYFSQVKLGFAPTSGQAAANYLQAQFPGQFIQDPNIGQVVPSSIVISGTQFNPSGPSFVLTWTATAGATYSVYKTNVITGSSANWPVIKANYPVGGAAGGPLSYTDTTTTISPAFYRVSRP